MTVPMLLADASALQEIPRLVRPDGKAIYDLLDVMTDAVEEGRLQFPKDVVDDLRVSAQSEAICGWATGLGRNLRSFRADFSFNRPVMRYAKQLGFEYGFESLDSSEVSIVAVARLACQYTAENQPFVIVTEDTGEGPLAPTMEQLCNHAAWQYCGARDAIERLGMGSLLV
jgi:hypothetical protein